MKNVTKMVVNPDTNQYYMEQMPESENVRQAILEIDFPQNGIKIKDATRILARTFSLSDEQIKARNSSNLNFFRHNVVSPQFKYLLEVGKLKQPGGPKTPYFHAESSSDSLDTELRETPPEPEWTSSEKPVDRIAVNLQTGKIYQIKLPATHIVKKALLDFDYPASGIEIKDVAEALADQFALTDEQIEARYKYGLVWRRHVNVAANTLVDSEKLFRVKRGWITNLEQPDIETSYPGVETSLDDDGDSPFSDGDTPSPEVVIEQNYREHRNQLKAELLQQIMDNLPDFFEELVLDLLFKMGYCSSRADAEAVGRSGDGGIDGIIKQDKLGLDLIYVQAKRESNNVNVSKVRDFTGALDSKGAQKGIFITTSDFTRNAKKFVEELSAKRIILIDREQLVQLMIDHNLGISLGNFYQLKDVDVAYFTKDDAGDAG